MGENNDNSVLTLMRMLPHYEKDGTISYEKQVVYIETMNGSVSEVQALRLKRLFYDFEADEICMDCNGNGISVYDELIKVTYDEERDMEYSPFVAYNSEKMSTRADKVGLPVIYSVKVNNTEENHKMAMGLKSAFQQKTIKLLLNDIEGKEYLADKMALAKKSSEEQARLLKPFVQTTIMVNETINLTCEVKGGFFKISEQGGARKDRYSSLSYAHFIAKKIENEENKKRRKGKSRNGAFNLW